MNAFFPLATVFGLTAVLLLGGCGTLSQQNYYLMTATAPAQVQPLGDLRLGVGPVKLADHLQRTNIVTRESATRIRLAPDDRWAAPLDTHASELLAASLKERLGLSVVPVFPWPPGSRVDYQLALDISEFIYSNGLVHLDVQWRLLDGPSSVLVDRSSQISEPSGPGYDSIVAAMSAALGRFADEVAAEIHRLRARR